MCEQPLCDLHEGLHFAFDFLLLPRQHMPCNLFLQFLQRFYVNTNQLIALTFWGPLIPPGDLNNKQNMINSIKMVAPTETWTYFYPPPQQDRSLLQSHRDPGLSLRLRRQMERLRSRKPRTERRIHLNGRG